MFLLGGCEPFLATPGEGPEDDPPRSQTAILRVEVRPNPAVVGETVRFVCVIADSTDERFQFYWSLSGGSPTGSVTSKNTLTWNATAPGEYYHAVQVDNGDAGSFAPVAGFSVRIVEGSD